MSDGIPYPFVKTPFGLTDVGMKLASNAFWDKHGRAPTQAEWEQYYINGGTFERPDVH